MRDEKTKAKIIVIADVQIFFESLFPNIINKKPPSGGFLYQGVLMNQPLLKKKEHDSGSINNKIADASKNVSNKQHAETVFNNHHYQNEIVRHAPTNRGK